jgi:integrase
MALGILEELKVRAKNPKLKTCGSQWVFPTYSRKTPGEDLHVGNIQKAADRIQDTARKILKVKVFDFQAHDLRRTAASNMTSMGFDRYKHVAKILNHVEPGVTGVYDRHSYDAEKREALEGWAVKLGEILTAKPTSEESTPPSASPLDQAE